MNLAVILSENGTSIGGTELDPQIKWFIIIFFVILFGICTFGQLFKSGDQDK